MRVIALAALLALAAPVAGASHDPVHLTLRYASDAYGVADDDLDYVHAKAVILTTEWRDPTLDAATCAVNSLSDEDARLTAACLVQGSLRAYRESSETLGDITRTVPGLVVKEEALLRAYLDALLP